MEKYHRVDRTQKDEHTQAAANEIRMTQHGKIRSYVNYATNLFKESNEECIFLKAMGNVISKAVTISEVLKHRVPGLHQITEIGLHQTTDVYEPLEEGLDRIEIQRQIPFISIQLSIVPLDSNNPGYQSPLPAELVSETPRITSYRGNRTPKDEDASDEENAAESQARAKKQGKRRSQRGTARRNEENTELASEENKDSNTNASDDEAIKNRRKSQGRGRNYRGRNSNRGPRGRGKSHEAAQVPEEADE